ncbi:discoidin domain-containing protein [Chitinophaga agrisoli]|uniref:Discoidin domain-containing protein n=1 Tax=Chitinophaga agrisoli TaxID=2607653 RepID=A0A5B2VIF8_9BACT|nr:discoidin domain-containing protein [Chitinophaga agrisoli]KAA2239363.1 discoidin domain-containing protein [Chitinophaga agrisoli]
MRYPIPLLLVACIFLSCHHLPSRVNAVLEMAGNNRAELEKVITHYRNEPEKLRAAYFLISNMPGHFTYEGDAVQHFSGIFTVLDSLHRKGIKVPTTSPILKHAWDSLVSAYGSRPTTQEAEVHPDYLSLSASFLISHIDASFKVWKESPWCKQLRFEQFCEYLLPYRAGRERPELFHNRLRERFALLRDTSRAKNSYDFTDQFNQQIRAFIGLNNTMRLYPFDMSVSEMEKARRGSCAHLCQYETQALRANGIPAAVDYVPVWGDLNRGHEWVALLQENGKCFAFNAGGAGFGGIYDCPYRYSKVYRKTFALQETGEAPPGQQVPESLLNQYRRDVTEEYTKVSDLDIPLTRGSDIPRSYAVLCTFRTSSWGAQAYGPIENKHARFSKIGRNLLYIVMYYYQGKYYPATDPFILQDNGQIRYLRGNAQPQPMQLLRKYPRFPAMLEYMGAMVGGRFQGANKPDFSDSVNLFTVTGIPAKLETAPVTTSHPFRYVRFIPAHGIKANIAELMFYSNDTAVLQGKTIGFPEVSQDETGTALQNVFDGQLETYFSGIKNGVCWVGLDLGKPYTIRRIRYCPRSDTNFILEGDTYALSYWNGEKWVNAGKQIAAGSPLSFPQAPAGRVYILHNLSKGNEERIFTYENGQQVWW